MPAGVGIANAFLGAASLVTHLFTDPSKMGGDLGQMLTGTPPAQASGDAANSAASADTLTSGQLDEIEAMLKKKDDDKKDADLLSSVGA